MWWQILENLYSINYTDNQFSGFVLLHGSDNTVASKISGLNSDE
jgi:hypothetical protein